MWSNNNCLGPHWNAHYFYIACSMQNITLQLFHFVMACALDTHQLYVIGISLGCVHGPTIITLAQIEMFTVFIQHALHTLFLFSKLIYFWMAQAADADQLYVIGISPVCVCGSSIITSEIIEMIIIFVQIVQHDLCSLFLYMQLIYFEMAPACGCRPFICNR